MSQSSEAFETYWSKKENLRKYSEKEIAMAAWEAAIVFVIESFNVNDLSQPKQLSKLKKGKFV